MKRKFYWILVALIALMIILTGCQCKHEWKEATCTEPKTCVKCGETEGDALGHSWNDATCVNPMTCKVCGKTDGQPLGHTGGNWSEEKIDAVKAISVSVEVCKVCGAELSRRELPLESLVNGDSFIISPRDFVERLQIKYAEITPDISIRTGKQGGTFFVCGLLRDEKQLGVLKFKDNADNTIVDSQKHDLCLAGLRGTISDNITDVLSAIVLVFDPTKDFDSAQSVAFKVIVDGVAKENGILYECRVSDGGGFIWVNIDNQ